MANHKRTKVDSQPSEPSEPSAPSAPCLLSQALHLANAFLKASRNFLPLPNDANMQEAVSDSKWPEEPIMHSLALQGPCNSKHPPNSNEYHQCGAGLAQLKSALAVVQKLPPHKSGLLTLLADLYCLSENLGTSEGTHDRRVSSALD